MRRFTLTRRYAVIAAYALLALSCENALGPTSTDDVGRVTVDPATMNLVAGNSQPAIASVVDASGQVLSGHTVIWSTQNAAVATVTQSGTVTAVSSGTTQVAASAGGKSGIIDVTVSGRPVALVRVTPQATQVLVGASTPLSVAVLDAQGDPVPGKTVTWGSTNENIASVSTTGNVTGVSAGSATISATVDGLSGSSNVTVNQTPVAKVTISPNGGHITAGGTIQLSALVEDSKGNTLSGRIVTWESSDETIATVSSNGLVRGVLPGKATITARSEGKSDQVTINVTAAAVSSVEVTPSRSTVATGQTVQLSVRLTDASGNVLTGRLITWSTNTPSVATVTAGGTVTGVAQGTAQIIAESEGVQGNALVDVTAIPVASVSVTPSPVTLDIGQSQTLTATARDASGNILSGRPVTWDSDNPAVASVSVAGVVTGVSVGVTLVNATMGGISKGVPVTVVSTTIATITVTPDPASVEEGKTLQLTATARDAAGNTMTGQTITWSSSNPQITVSSSGLVTAAAGAGGQGATITASSPGGGLGGTTPSGVATVNVSYAPVATIVVNPASPTLIPGGTISLAATLLDAAGQTLSAAGRTITWASANSAIASVSSSGDVTGNSSGSTTVTVTAASPGQSTPASKGVPVTVSAPVASVNISGGPTINLSLLTKPSDSRTVRVRDALGNNLVGRACSIVSSDTNVATVTPGWPLSDASGQLVFEVRAGNIVGSAVINVTCEGIGASVNVSVSP